MKVITLKVVGGECLVLCFVSKNHFYHLRKFIQKLN